MTSKSLKYLMTCITVLFLCGFTHARRDREHLNQSTILCDKTDAKLYKKHGLSIFGKGGSLVFNVKEISRTYRYFEPVDIDQARILITNSAQYFLQAFNDDIEIRPLLNEYPFTTKHLNLSILCVNPETGECYSPPSIACIAVHNGTVKYYTSPHPAFPFKAIKKETYEEACILAQKD